MSGHERLVYHFLLQVGVNKAAASPPDLRSVLVKIWEAFKAGKASLAINKGTATLDILDMKFDDANDLVTLLIRNSDQNGSDVYFADTVAKTSRIERKKGREGRGFGAHLTISLKSETGRPNLHLAVLERVSNVNSSFVARLLQSILRELYKADPNLFTCDDISGARDRHGSLKKVGFRPMLELDGLPSGQLIDDLENGTIQDILLIQDVTVQQFGARPWLQEHERTIKISPSQARPANVWNDLKGLFQDQSKAGIARARIRFRRADGEAGTVHVDAVTGSILDDRYIKATRITPIFPPLDECSDAIVTHFALMIEKEVLDNRS